MRKRWLVFLMAAGLLLAGSPAVRADLFEDSLAALTNDKLDAARFDRFGQSLRGGLAAGYPQLPPGNPILHDFNLSTSCGSFSFGAGLIDNLSGMLDPDVLVGSLVKGLQDSVHNLIGAAVSKLSMLSACYAVPTLCDVTKHLQSLTNEIFQGKSLSCQQAENLMAGLGARLTGARTSRCISAQQRAGKTLAAAEAACHTATAAGIVDHSTGMDIMDAGSDGNSKLIEDSLTRADAPVDIRDFARDLLGEVEVKPGATPEEPVDVDVKEPSKRLHDVYRTERGQLSAKIDDAIAIVGAGNDLTAAKHKDVSLPGLAMPYGVLEAMWDIRQVDPVAYADYRDKLAGTFAMLGLSWRVNELRDLLEEGMLDNTRLSEAEADIIRARLARLERERDRFVSEKELMERHALPILQAILLDNREREQAAGTAAVEAGVAATAVANRFGAQLPMGYGY